MPDSSTSLRFLGHLALQTDRFSVSSVDSQLLLDYLVPIMMLLPIRKSPFIKYENITDIYTCVYFPLVLFLYSQTTFSKAIHSCCPPALSHLGPGVVWGPYWQPTERKSNTVWLLSLWPWHMLPQCPSNSTLNWLPGAMTLSISTGTTLDASPSWAQLSRNHRLQTGCLSEEAF